MRAFSQKYDVCRPLIPIWAEKYERGELARLHRQRQQRNAAALGYLSPMQFEERTAPARSKQVT